MVDIGSSICRFGSGGEDLPKHVFRSEIGRYYYSDMDGSITVCLNVF